MSQQDFPVLLDNGFVLRKYNEIRMIQVDSGRWVTLLIRDLKLLPGDGFQDSPDSRHLGIIREVFDEIIQFGGYAVPVF